MSIHPPENESFTSTNSSTSNSKLEEEDEEYWDEEEEDEEITELREVLERSRRTVSYMEDSSGDSLDFEDNEMIKAKLRALREYAKDLQASYNELLLTFRQLEDAAKQKVNTMEGKLAAALKCAKDFQERCNLLESQLKELKERSLGVVGTNHPLPVNGENKEAQTQLAAIESDLSSVLKTITEGVESGVIKLSELQLLTQENLLPLQDVVLEGRGQKPNMPRPVESNNISITATSTTCTPTQLNDSQYYTESTDPLSDQPSNMSEGAWSTKQDGHPLNISVNDSNRRQSSSHEPQSHSETGSDYQPSSSQFYDSTGTSIDTHSNTTMRQTDSQTGDSVTEATPTSSISSELRPSSHMETTPSSVTTNSTKELSRVTTPTTATPSSSTLPGLSSSATPPIRNLSSDYDERTILNPVHESTRMSISEYENESPNTQTNSYYQYEDDGSHDNDNTLAQILEKDCRIAELETSVQDLQHKLQEYEHLHETTQMNLKDTEKLLEKQKLNKTLANDEDLSDTMSRIGQYEDDRGKLQTLVDKEREKVVQLETHRDDAMTEIEALKNRVRELTLMSQKDSSTDSEGEIEVDKAKVKEQLAFTDTTLADVHDDTRELVHMKEHMQHQCDEAGNKVTMLQQSLKTAKNEAHKLQAITARKESELVKVMSAIHATRAKMASLHKSSDSSPVPSAVTGQNNDENTDNNLQGLEWDVTTLQKKWEELCDDLSKHEAAIASLTGREITLQSELDHRAARILELEALTQAKEFGAGFNKKSASSLQRAVGLIKSEITHTKKEHINANKQMEGIYKQLNMSVHALVSQLELLKKQVSSKEKQIGDLQTEQRQIWQLYQLHDDKIKEEEAIKQDREQMLTDLEMELQSNQQRVEELEQAMSTDQELRKKDLDYQQAMMTDLVNQLQQLTRNEEDVNGLSVVPGEPMSLQVRIDQRDKLLQSLQEQTSLIIEQHANLVQQTDERQDLVKDFETKLLTTQTMCDALEQEVADGHKRLAKVQRQLAESEQERLELLVQMEKLQHEAEDTCANLENAINKNALLKQHGEDQMGSMKRQVEAHKLLQEHSETKVMELTDAMDDKIHEINSLRGFVEQLETDNETLRLDSRRTQVLLEKLQEELDLHGVDADTLQRELSDRLVAIETLRLQLDNVESAKRTAEAMAQERLKDVMSLQHLNQELSTTNTQLKLKLSSSAAAQVRQDRVEMLNEEVDTMKALYAAKSEELDKFKYSHQLLLKKEEDLVQKLEECRRELAICKKRADELDTVYQSSLLQLSATQTELDNVKTLQSMMEQQISEDNLKRSSSNKEQLTVLRGKTVRLQKQLIDSNTELERTQNELRNVTDEKRKLLRKLGALEEHYHSLIRTSSQQKLDLDRSQRRGEEQHKLRVTLQRDYDGLTEQVSDWAVTHKTTTDALIQKIREQDITLTSLKAKQKELASENSALRDDLNQRLSTGQSPVSARGATRSSPGELPQLHNQYQHMLEKGLASTSALDTSGYSSPAESTDDLDKSYWIKRAGELSVQLQQSSEYWSNKVREQSLKIEKYESK